MIINNYLKHQGLGKYLGLALLLLVCLWPAGQSQAALQCDKPVVVVPTSISPLTGNIILDWEPVAFAKRYIVKVYDAAGNLVRQSEAKNGASGYLLSYNTFGKLVDCGKFTYTVEAECCGDRCDTCEKDPFFVGLKNDLANKDKTLCQLLQLQWMNDSALGKVDSCLCNGLGNDLVLYNESTKFNPLRTKFYYGALKPTTPPEAIYENTVFAAGETDGCAWSCYNNTKLDPKSCGVKYKAYCYGDSDTTLGVNNHIVNGSTLTYNFCSLDHKADLRISGGLADQYAYTLGTPSIKVLPKLVLGKGTLKWEWRCGDNPETCKACRMAQCGRADSQVYTQAEYDNLTEEYFCDDGSGIKTVPAMSAVRTVVNGLVTWQCIGDTSCDDANQQNKNYRQVTEGYNSNGKQEQRKVWQPQSSCGAQIIKCGDAANIAWTSSTMAVLTGTDGTSRIDNMALCGSGGLYKFKSLSAQSSFNSGVTAKIGGAETNTWTWTCVYNDPNGNNTGKELDCQAPIADCFPKARVDSSNLQYPMMTWWENFTTTSFKGSFIDEANKAGNTWANYFCANGRGTNIVDNDRDKITALPAKTTDLAKFENATANKFYWSCFDSKKGEQKCERNITHCADTSAIKAATSSASALQKQIIGKGGQDLCINGKLQFLYGETDLYTQHSLKHKNYLDQLKSFVKFYSYACADDLGDIVECQVDALDCNSATVEDGEFADYIRFNTKAGGKCTPKGSGGNKWDCFNVCTDPTVSAEVTYDSANQYWKWTCGENDCRAMKIGCKDDLIASTEYYADWDEFITKIKTNCGYGRNCDCGQGVDKKDCTGVCSNDTKSVEVTKNEGANGKYQFEWSCDTKACEANLAGCGTASVPSDTGNNSYLTADWNSIKNSASGTNKLCLNGGTPEWNGSNGGWTGYGLNEWADQTDPIKFLDYTDNNYREGSWMWTCKYGDKQVPKNSPFIGTGVGDKWYGKVGGYKDFFIDINPYCFAYEKPECSTTSPEFKDETEVRSAASSTNPQKRGNTDAALCQNGVVEVFTAERTIDGNKINFVDGVGCFGDKCYYYCAPGMGQYGLDRTATDSCSVSVAAGCRKEMIGGYFTGWDELMSRGGQNNGQNIVVCGQTDPVNGYKRLCKGLCTKLDKPVVVTDIVDTTNGIDHKFVWTCDKEACSAFEAGCSRIEDNTGSKDLTGFANGSKTNFDSVCVNGGVPEFINVETYKEPGSNDYAWKPTPGQSWSGVEGSTAKKSGKFIGQIPFGYMNFTPWYPSSEKIWDGYWFWRCRYPDGNGNTRVVSPVQNKYMLLDVNGDNNGEMWCYDKEQGWCNDNVFASGSTTVSAMLLNGDGPVGTGGDLDAPDGTTRGWSYKYANDRNADQVKSLCDNSVLYPLSYGSAAVQAKGGHGQYYYCDQQTKTCYWSCFGPGGNTNFFVDQLVLGYTDVWHSRYDKYCQVPYRGCKNYTGGVLDENNGLNGATTTIVVWDDLSSKNWLSKMLCDDGVTPSLVTSPSTNQRGWTWECAGDKCSADQSACNEPPHGKSISLTEWNDEYDATNCSNNTYGTKPCVSLCADKTSPAVTRIKDSNGNWTWNWVCDAQACFASQKCNMDYTPLEPAVKITPNKDPLCAGVDEAVATVSNTGDCDGGTITYKWVLPTSFGTLSANPFDKLTIKASHTAADTVAQTRTIKVQAVCEMLGCGTYDGPYKEFDINTKIKKTVDAKIEGLPQICSEKDEDLQYKATATNCADFTVTTWSLGAADITSCADSLSCTIPKNLITNKGAYIIKAKYICNDDCALNKGVEQELSKNIEVVEVKTPKIDITDNSAKPLCAGGEADLLATVTGCKKVLWVKWTDVQVSNELKQESLAANIFTSAWKGDFTGTKIKVEALCQAENDCLTGDMATNTIDLDITADTVITQEVTTTEAKKDFCSDNGKQIFEAVTNCKIIKGVTWKLTKNNGTLITPLNCDNATDFKKCNLDLSALAEHSGYKLTATVDCGDPCPKYDPAVPYVFNVIKKYPVPQGGLIIKSTPSDTNVCADDTPTLSIQSDAATCPDKTYQWQKKSGSNWIDISDSSAKAPFYKTDPITVNASYRLVRTCQKDSLCVSTSTSNIYDFTVKTKVDVASVALAITSPIPACKGDGVEFKATPTLTPAGSTCADMKYIWKWKESGVDKTDSTAGNTITLNGLKSGEDVSVEAWCNDSCSLKTHKTAIHTLASSDIQEYRTITGQPTVTAVPTTNPLCIDSTVKFTAGAVGVFSPTCPSGKLKYKWFINDAEIIGYTTADFTYKFEASSGNKNVKVELMCDDVCTDKTPTTSSPYDLTVKDKAKVSDVVVTTNNNEVCQDEDVTVNGKISFVGDCSEYKYEWLIDGVSSGEKTGVNTGLSTNLTQQITMIANHKTPPQKIKLIASCTKSTANLSACVNTTSDFGELSLDVTKYEFDPHLNLLDATTTICVGKELTVDLGGVCKKNGAVANNYRYDGQLNGGGYTSLTGKIFKIDPIAKSDEGYYTFKAICGLSSNGLVEKCGVVEESKTKNTNDRHLDVVVVEQPDANPPVPTLTANPDAVCSNRKTAIKAVGNKCTVGATTVIWRKWTTATGWQDYKTTLETANYTIAFDSENITETTKYEVTVKCSNSCATNYSTPVTTTIAALDCRCGASDGGAFTAWSYASGAVCKSGAAPVSAPTPIDGVWKWVCDYGKDKDGNDQKFDCSASQLVCGTEDKQYRTLAKWNSSVKVESTQLCKIGASNNGGSKAHSLIPANYSTVLSDANIDVDHVKTTGKNIITSYKNYGANYYELATATAWSCVGDSGDAGDKLACQTNLVDCGIASGEQTIAKYGVDGVRVATTSASNTIYRGSYNIKNTPTHLNDNVCVNSKTPVTFVDGKRGKWQWSCVADDNLTIDCSARADCGNAGTNTNPVSTVSITAADQCWTADDVVLNSNKGLYFSEALKIQDTDWGTNNTDYSKRRLANPYINNMSGKPTGLCADLIPETAGNYYDVPADADWNSLLQALKTNSSACSSSRLNGTSLDHWACEGAAAITNGLKDPIGFYAVGTSNEDNASLAGNGYWTKGVTFLDNVLCSQTATLNPPVYCGSSTKLPAQKYCTRSPYYYYFNSASSNTKVARRSDYDSATASTNFCDDGAFPPQGTTTHDGELKHRLRCIYKVVTTRCPPGDPNCNGSGGTPAAPPPPPSSGAGTPTPAPTPTPTTTVKPATVTAPTVVPRTVVPTTTTVKPPTTTTVKSTTTTTVAPCTTLSCLLQRLGR